MHLKYGPRNSAYRIKSEFGDRQLMSVPICEKGGKRESMGAYFNNLISIGSITDQGVAQEAAFSALKLSEEEKDLRNFRQWKLPPIPNRLKQGYSNIGKELRRWGEIHREMDGLLHKDGYKGPTPPSYNENHFNYK